MGSVYNEHKSVCTNHCASFLDTVFADLIQVSLCLCIELLCFLVEEFRQHVFDESCLVPFHSILSLEKCLNRLHFTCWAKSNFLNRLYAKGRITGHTRGKRNSKEHTTLVQIEGTRTAKETDFYLGKRIAFVYRAKRVVDGSRVRVIWGRITRPHGKSGSVRAKFASNIPPKAFGAAVRIMLYPSRV